MTRKTTIFTTVLLLLLLCSSALAAKEDCNERQYWDGTQCIVCYDTIEGCFACEHNIQATLQCFVCYSDYQIFEGRCVKLIPCVDECGSKQVCNTFTGQCENCFTEQNPFCSSCIFDTISASKNCTECAIGLKPDELGQACLCQGNSTCALSGEVCVRDKCVKCNDAEVGIKYCRECTTFNGHDVICNTCLHPFQSKDHYCGCGVNREQCKTDRTQFCDAYFCRDCSHIHDKCIECETKVIDALTPQEEELVASYRFLQTINAAPFGICHKCSAGYQLKGETCFEQSGAKLALSLAALLATLLFMTIA